MAKFYAITDKFDVKEYHTVVTYDQSSTTLFGHFEKVEFVPVGESYKATFTTTGFFELDGSNRCYVRMADKNISDDVLTLNSDNNVLTVNIPKVTGDVYICVIGQVTT